MPMKKESELTPEEAALSLKAGLLGPASGMEETVSIWVCSWNMAAQSHFSSERSAEGSVRVDRSEISARIAPVVPSDYDVYVFGVQEAVDESFLDCVAGYLGRFGVTRLALDPKCDRVFGRGDGSFLSPKFTGVAVFVSTHVFGTVTCVAHGSVSCGLMEGSKGAAAVALRIYASTVCFLSSHLSSNAPCAKRAHFRTIVDRAGAKLGTAPFSLLHQFDHVVWFGDLNYRLQAAEGWSAVECMANGRVHELWAADSLRKEMLGRGAFAGFLEPIPRPDFYPTYKKRPLRSHDFWFSGAEHRAATRKRIHAVYNTRFKVPFYKGGAVEERCPSFTDRLLWHSVASCNGRLLPQKDAHYRDAHYYGAVQNHLLGSDHSAIYCGLSLCSAVLRQRPPFESDAFGRPKHYVLRIDCIEVLRIDATTGRRLRSLPLKAMLLFPAPYQTAARRSLPRALSKADLRAFHRVRAGIQALSRRRLAAATKSTDVFDAFSPKRKKKKKKESLAALHLTESKSDDEEAEDCIVPMIQMLSAVPSKRRNTDLLLSAAKRKTPRSKRFCDLGAAKRVSAPLCVWDADSGVHLRKSEPIAFSGLTQDDSLHSYKRPPTGRRPLQKPIVTPRRKTVSSVTSTATLKKATDRRPPLPSKRPPPVFAIGSPVLSPKAKSEMLISRISEGAEESESLLSAEVVSDYFGSRPLARRRSASFTEGDQFDVSDAEAEELERASKLHRALQRHCSKLTLRCFGGEMRAAHGCVHLLARLKTEAADGAQCAFAFKWTDFGEEMSGTKEAALTLSGIPLKDSVFGTRLKCAIRYRLSLADT